jgi:hypothetical protein
MADLMPPVCGMRVHRLVLQPEIVILRGGQVSAAGGDLGGHAEVAV